MRSRYVQAKRTIILFIHLRSDGGCMGSGSDVASEGRKALCGRLLLSFEEVRCGKGQLGMGRQKKQTKRGKAKQSKAKAWSILVQDVIG